MQSSTLPTIVTISIYCCIINRKFVKVLSYISLKYINYNYSFDILALKVEYI